MRLAGKVALIVPGTYGVGHAAALRFACEGARVVVCGMDEHNGRKTVVAVERAGGNAHFQRCDLLQEPDLSQVAAAAVQRFGALHIVFGCPDYYAPGLLLEQPAQELDLSLHYNCRSLFLLTKHALPLLQGSGGGSIIFLSSAYAQVSGSSSSAYEISMGTVVHMARVFGERYAAARIRVNCIAAGHTYSPPDPEGPRDELPSYLVRDPAEAHRLAPFYPAGRLATPEDIAAAALFLASDDSAYLAGATLPLEGGFLTR